MSEMSIARPIRSYHSLIFYFSEGIKPDPFGVKVKLPYGCRLIITEAIGRILPRYMLVYF
jgi:hypothetical protein